MAENDNKISQTPIENKTLNFNLTYVISKIKKSRALMAGIIAIVIILGGSAGAYFGVAVPNRPSNVLNKGLRKTLEQHKITVKSAIDVSGQTNSNSGLSNVDVNYTGQFDMDKHATASVVEVDYGGFKIPVELRTIDRAIYIKIGDLTNVVKILGGVAPKYGPLADSINKNLSNQWVIVDESLLKQFKLECLLDFPQPLSKQDINLILGSYKDSPFATLQSTRPEIINGRSHWRYDYIIDGQKTTEFNNKLNDLSVVKKLRECTRQNSDLTNKVSAKDSKVPLSLWIDKRSKLISRMEVSVDEQKARGKTTIDLSYDNFTITKPEGAKSLAEALQAISGSLSGLLQPATP